MVSIEILTIALATLIIINCWWLIGLCWSRIGLFFHNNYSYFEVSFIVAYFVEQLILIVLLIIKPAYTTFWVGVFSLIVITTAALEKTSMDSRDKKLRKLYAAFQGRAGRTAELNETLIEENKNLMRSNKKIIDLLHQSKAK